MSVPDDVRQLSGTLQRALVIENPDPKLDELLRAQGFEVDRVTSGDRTEILDKLGEGQHELLFKRSQFVVDDEVHVLLGGREGFVERPLRRRRRFRFRRGSDFSGC